MIDVQIANFEELAKEQIKKGLEKAIERVESMSLGDWLMWYLACQGDE